MSTTESVLIASDHAGYKLKEYLIHHLAHIMWADLGTYNDERVDYPDFASLAAEKINHGDVKQAVLICGSGQGMAMRANKYPNVRAALCWNPEVATLARQHNDANILCLGERVMDHALCEEIVKAFLETEFEGGRHEARVKKINQPVHGA